MREVVLWGQHLDEYFQMFDLTQADCDLKLLEYGCGATAVNSELCARKQSMVSCDPLFSMKKNQLEPLVHQTFDEAIAALCNSKDQFDLSYYGDDEALIAKRLKGITAFLSDYEQGLQEKRYWSDHAGVLPFEDFAFDLVLSGYYLFTALENEDVECHLRLIRELARVAKEVRIFPLIDRQGQPSSILGPVLLGLQQNHYGVEIRDVHCQLQRQGRAMLRVWARECSL